MKNRVSAVVIIIILSSFFETICAQTPDWRWAKTFGGHGLERSKSIVSGDSLFYMAGEFSDSVDFDTDTGTFIIHATNESVYICKRNESGQLIWARHIGGPAGFAAVNSLSVDDSMNVYAVGYFNGTIDMDPGAAVLQMTSTGPNDDMYILKLNDSGDFVWAQRIDASDICWPQSMAIGRNNDIYVCGYFEDSVDFDPGPGSQILIANGHIDMFLFKLNFAGNYVWSKQISSDDYVNPWCLALDDSENIYVTGEIDGTIDFDPGPGTFFINSNNGSYSYVAKYTASGNFIWVKAFEGWSSFGISVVAGRGGIYATGYYYGTVDFDPGTGHFYMTSLSPTQPAFNTDIFVVKLDTAGLFAWAKTISGHGGDFPNTTVLDTLENLYLCGTFTDTIDFNPDPIGVYSFALPGFEGAGFVSNLDSSGNFKWAKVIVGGIPQDLSIAIDRKRNLFFSGIFQNYTVWFDSIQINMDTTNRTDVCFAKLGCISNTVFYISACNEYSFPGEPSPWTTSGTYSVNVPSAGECDSVVTIHLTILSSTDSTFLINACNQYLSPSGKPWNTSGIYQDTIPNAAGCDSILTIHLSIDTVNTFSSFSVSSCTEYLSPAGHVWTASGIYTDTLLNASGCDSVITIDLTMTTIDTSISTNGYFLEANDLDASYQWLDCGNGLPLQGDTSRILNTSANGNYAVVVTRNGCTDTSSCYTLHSNSFFEIYPNPAISQFYFVVYDSSKPIDVSIFNTLGEMVYSKKIQLQNHASDQINTSDFSSGVYLVQVIAEDRIETKKFIILK